MIKNNEFVDFLRAYGPSPSSNNMYDEHVVDAIDRYRAQPLRIEVPRLETVVDNFRLRSPCNIVLTGTAGDGKTYLCRMAFLKLGGALDEWKASGKVVVRRLEESGKTLRIIKDLSELSDDEKERELGVIADALLNGAGDVVYLVAANDGQLLKFWRDYSRLNPATRGIHDRLAYMLDAEESDDSTGTLSIRLYNLSREPAHRLLDQVVDQIVEHPGWKACQGCELHQRGTCSIQLNRDLLRSPADSPFRARLRSIVQLAAANDMHLPMRQLLLLVVNILLGDAKSKGMLTCRQAANRAADADYKCTNPFNNALGLNLTPKNRRQFAVFALLEQFGLGRETNNALDSLLVDREPASLLEQLEMVEATYGERLFEKQRATYLRGLIEDFDAFREELESQRRRLFFILPVGDETSGAHALTPWNLTVFMHGGTYLRFQEGISRRLPWTRAVEEQLVLGLNRTFTGTMCRNGEAIWPVMPAGNTQNRLGKVIEGAPVSRGSGGSLVTASFDTGGLHGRPRLVVTDMRTEREIAHLELRPLLFEYLMRVASGSLPASFSRQCFEELRHFRQRLISRLRSEKILRHESDLEYLEMVSLTPDGKLQREPVGVLVEDEQCRW